jgi:hypothetical protein
MAEPRDLSDRLAQAERSLAAHDFLLRALLSHLALTDPQGFAGLVAGFTNSRLYHSPGTAGDLTREVAEQLTRMIEEIAASLSR